MNEQFQYSVRKHFDREIQEPEEYMIDQKTWIIGVKEECENIQVVENVYCIQACVFVEMQKWLEEL